MSRVAVTVRLEPGDEILELSKAGNVGAMLKRMGLRGDEALVIRGSELLTPDRMLKYGDSITVRRVGSRG